MGLHDSIAQGAACPKCGGQNFTRWAWPHAVIVHWVLNPGLALVEIPLGLRIPRIMLLCNGCRNGYVPCPKCGMLHYSFAWRGLKGLGHWFGYVCPHCHAIIPCIWNAWSLMVLAVTFPVWYLPARLIKPHWLKFEQQRTAQMSQSPPTIRWAWVALFMGGMMWVALSVPAFIRMIAYHKFDRLWYLLLNIPIAAAPPLFLSWRRLRFWRKSR